jgi:hypothetical protein
MIESGLRAPQLNQEHEYAPINAEPNHYNRDAIHESGHDPCRKFRRCWMDLRVALCVLVRVRDRPSEQPPEQRCGGRSTGALGEDEGRHIDWTNPSEPQNAVIVCRHRFIFCILHHLILGDHLAALSSCFMIMSAIQKQKYQSAITNP